MYRDFLEAVATRAGISTADAERVVELWRREKLLNVPTTGGNYGVKHGALMEPEVIRRALDLVRAEEAGCNFA